jgi:hypothetical protein
MTAIVADIPLSKKIKEMLQNAILSWGRFFAIMIILSAGTIFPLASLLQVIKIVCIVFEYRYKHFIKKYCRALHSKA